MATPTGVTGISKISNLLSYYMTVYLSQALNYPKEGGFSLLP